MTAPMTETEDGSDSLSRLMSAVGDEHRRAVLRQLKDADGETLDIDELTDQVAERLGDGDRPTDDFRRRVRLTLHHNHLPKLASHGLIRYDTETGQVKHLTDGTGGKLPVLLRLYETGG